MDKVSIDLKYCYGIKALKTTLDFSETAAYAIYAPNGVMKSSLAQTFLDAANGEKSKDRIFPAHKTERKIADENGAEVEGHRILVVVPYDPDIGPGEQASVLLVNAKLRDEYTKLFVDINATKTDLLDAIRVQAKSKNGLHPVPKTPS